MMAAPDTLYQPEGTKRVVTASGKIIETETDLLQKKLEKKRGGGRGSGSRGFGGSGDP